MADLILGSARLVQSCEPKKDHSGCNVEIMQNREGKITFDKQSDSDPSVIDEASSNIGGHKADAGSEVNGKPDGDATCLRNREDNRQFGIESRESHKGSFSSEFGEQCEPQCSEINKDVLAFSKGVCRGFGEVLKRNIEESDGRERNHEGKDNTDILNNDKEADSGCDVLDPDRVEKLEGDSVHKDCSHIQSSDTCNQEKDKLSLEDGGDSSFAENVTKEIDDDRGESCNTDSQFSFKGETEKKDTSHMCNTFEVTKMRVEFPGSAELDESFKSGLPLGTREETVDLDTVLNIENQTLNGVCLENEIADGVVIDGEEAESVLHNFVPHYDPDTETQLTDLSVSGVYTDGEGGGGEESSCNELGPHTKRRKLMEIEVEEEREKEENEESPVVGIRLAPVANGHGMWGSGNLRTLLQEKGSVTLQLFGSVTDYGVYMGKKDGDLLAVVVDVQNEPDPEDQVDFEQLDSAYDPLDPNFNQTLGFPPLSRKSRGRAGSRGRMSNRPLTNWHPYLSPNTQLMSSYHSLDNFFCGSEWQGKGYLSGHLRKIPFPSSQSLLPRRGPGRPPKTLRQAFSPPPFGIHGYYPRPDEAFGRFGTKSKFSSSRSRSFLKSPERTQSPPQFKFLEAMRKSGISFLDSKKSQTGSDQKKLAGDATKESHIGPPPTPPTKLPIISKSGMKSVDMEKKSPSPELTNGDIRSPSKVVKNPLIKIKCEFCETVFRKKAALNAHIKHKHRKMRECPICKEKIKIKGKYGMKFHILKMHKDMSRHQCDECDEAFKLRHHLINHKRMVHELGISDEETDDEDEDDDEEEEEDEESEVEIESEVEKIEKEKKTKSAPKIETDEEEEPVFRRTTRSNIRAMSAPEVEEKDEKEEQRSVAKNEQKNVQKSEPKSVPKAEPKTAQKNEPKEMKKGKASPVPSSSSSEGSSSDSEVEEPKKYFCDMCDLGFSHLFKMKHHKKEAHRKTPPKPVISPAKLAKLKMRPSKEDLTCSYCDRICRSMYQLGLHIDKHQRKGDMEREVGPKTLTARQIRILEAKKLAEEKQREKEAAAAAAAEEEEESQSEEESEEEAPPPGRPPNRRQIEKSLKAGQKEEESPKPGGTKPSGSKQKASKKKTNAKASPPPPLPPSEGKEEEEEEEVTQDENSKEVEDMSAYIINDGINFECTKCEVSFKREKYLTYHMKKIHETMYPFRACEFCGKIFRSSGPYNRHVTQHKVYNCPIQNCKAKYRNMRRMKQHQKNSHGDIPHRCPRCVELYVLEEQLEKHIKEKHPKNPSDDEDEDDEDGEDNERDDDENDNDANSDREEDKEKKAAKDKKGSKEDDESMPKDKKEERSRITRRTRCAPISYKESDDDDELIVYGKVRSREGIKNSSPESLEVQTSSPVILNRPSEIKDRLRTSPRKAAVKENKEYIEQSEEDVDAQEGSVTEEKDAEKRVPDPHADSDGEENPDSQDKDEKSLGQELLGKKGKDNGSSQEEESKKTTPSKNNKKSKSTSSKKSGGSNSPPKRQRKRRLRQSTRINSYQGGGVFYYSQDSQGFGDGYFMDTDSVFDFDEGSRAALSGKCPHSEEISDFMANEDGQVLTFDSF